MEKEVSEARCGVCTCAASHLCHLHLGLAIKTQLFPCTWFQVQVCVATMDGMISTCNCT